MIGIKTKINHNFPKDLKERNVHIALKPTPWLPSNGKVRRAFVNNFSAAGGNTALLVEDKPKPNTLINAEVVSDPRSQFLVAVSAKGVLSLKKNIQDLTTFIENTPDLSLPALSYTTTARRMHHSHRITIVGKNIDEIRTKLQSITSCDQVKPVPGKASEVAFAFTGQGSQYAGMGKQLMEFSQFRADMQMFDHMARVEGYPSILPYINGTQATPDDASTSPVEVQLAMTCMQMGLARLWTSWGIVPKAIVGHSLGEYAALYAAGVLSPSSVISLVGKRADLLQSLCTVGTHTMLAVKAPYSAVEHLMEGKGVSVACLNAPEETVISGKNEDVDRVMDTLVAQGMRAIKLKVPFAFHTSQVDPILKDFMASASGITFHKPVVPLISPLLTGVVTDEGTFGASYLARHCRDIVNFVGGIQAAREAKTITDKTVWIEIGPHPVCSGLIKAVCPTTTVVASLRRKEDTWNTLTTSLSSLYLAGIPLRWDDFHRDFDGCQKVIQLPKYNWNSKNYWIQYVHNWCLTKGNAPLTTTTSSLPPVAEEAKPIKYKTLTTSAQRIIEESGDEKKASIVVESDLMHPQLLNVVKGHTVNGAALIPSVSLAQNFYHGKTIF